MRLSIIGTAGRKDDAPRMSKELYCEMYRKALKYVQDNKITEVVSGGAAWADHIAVSLFLAGEVENLTLHLPANWTGDKYAPTRDGDTANYYHSKFSEKMGGNTLLGIQKAIEKGAKIHCHNGFKQRNLKVAESEHILAFTFGTVSSSGIEKAHVAGLKDGGTAHTWDSAATRNKTHVCLT